MSEDKPYDVCNSCGGSLSMGFCTLCYASQDASDLISKSEIARIQKAVTQLNNALASIRKRLPRANWYLEDSCNLNLLVDDSHDKNCIACNHRVMHRWILNYSGGGGW